MLAVPVTEPLAVVEAQWPRGPVLTGARAVAEALWLMAGGWRVLALLARLPGAEIAYRAIAANRGRLSRWVHDP